MKRTVVVLLIAACSAMQAQDFRNTVNRSLFSDQKAGRMGDAVTILVLESLSATNNAKTSASKKSNLSLALTTPSNSTGGSLGTGNEFKGEGATEANGTVQAKLSATVDSVLPNGNLIIRGHRRIALNGEEQVITISGVVRPSDIQADNSVFSFNISDADIVLEGSGIVAHAQGPGWVTKLLHWLL
jgi:flagellar L-ring protein FlgH